MYEKGQKQPSSYSCNELSKTRFFHVSIVNPDLTPFHKKDQIGAKICPNVTKQNHLHGSLSL